MIIITLLIVLGKVLVIMVEMMILAVEMEVEVILSIYHSFVEIWSSEVDSGRQFRILGVALVEYIHKRWTFGFETITNR